MRRCGYVVTSLSGAVLLAVLTCLEQVTNDGRGITTRKLRGPPHSSPLLVSLTATQMCRSEDWWITFDCESL